MPKAWKYRCEKANRPCKPAGKVDLGQDDPGQRSSRRLFEVAYTRSPYRFTIIGYPDIFNRLTPDDIRGYYRERAEQHVLRRGRRREVGGSRGADCKG